MKNLFFKSEIVLISLLILTPFGQLYAGDMELINLLINNLGVTEKQAAGGAGAIFDMTKQNLSAKDFLKIASAVPEAESLIDAAPKKSSGFMGSLMGTFSKTEKNQDKLGTIGNLAGSFSKIGLSSDMVGQFMPIILDYVKSKGGETAMNLMKGALM
jgi:hypothetical protein